MADSPTPIITVVASKGGVGKSATVTNIASCLARFETLNVLVVEVDEQSSVCYQLGYGINTKQHPKKGIVDIVLGERASDCISVVYAPVRKDNGEALGEVYILAGDSRIKSLNIEIVKSGKEGVFGKILTNIAKTGFFDVILVDTPPSSHLLTDEVWNVTDGLILPVCPHDGEGRESLMQTFERYKDVVAKTSRKPEVIGVIQTMVEVRTKIGREAKEIIEHNYKKRDMYLGAVPKEESMRKSVAIGRPICDVAPYSQAGLAYSRASKICKQWIEAFKKKYKES